MAFPVVPINRPSSLDGKTNGKLPSNILVAIPGVAGGAAITLVKPAARSWKAMAAAAKKKGHILKSGWETNSYRPYEDQVRIFTQRYTKQFLPGRPRRMWMGQWWYQKPGTALTAVPGTSNHGWGCAVDGGEERDGDGGSEPFDQGTLNWLLANADEFGYSWEVQSEPWHLHYFTGDNIPPAVIEYEKSLIEDAKPDPKPEPKPRKEDDTMIVIVLTDYNPDQFRLIAPDGVIEIDDEAAYRYGVGGVPAYKMSTKDYQTFVSGKRVHSFND